MLDLPLTFLQRPAIATTPRPWLLVLMHGVGSNEQDLMGLAPQMPERFHVLSLRAPFRMGPGSHAWFDFSIEPNGERSINEAQEAQSRALVAQAIASAAEQLGIPPERVVVGGFSQGGIMSLSLLLTQPALLHAICVWHSRLLPEVLPLQVPPAQLAGRQVWLSHGTQDNVIPLTSAHLTRARLEPLPVQLRYHEYPCAHTIHPDELRDCVQWLQGLTAAA